MSGVLGDVRFAVRMVLKTPWMSAAAVVSLAGAMAVTIGAFSLFWDSYFAALPFANADRIVAVRDRDVRQGRGVSPRVGELRDWQSHQRTFDVIGAAHSRTGEIADGAGGFARYRVSTMTASGFRVAGVDAMLGRVLSADDEAPGAEPVVVLGHRVWTHLFGSDPAAVGRMLDLDGTRRIVGVMPEGFRFPMSEDLWLPLRIDGAGGGIVEPQWIRVFGRLAPGVTRQQAEADLASIRSGRAAAHPEDLYLRDRRATVIPYTQSESDGDEGIFYAMFAFLLLVLAVACASVANLLLCRAMARQGELAVRAALGAQRSRLVSQLFIEALLITSIAAVAGIGAAGIGLRWFSDYIAIENLPFWVRFGISAPTAVFATVAAFIAAAMAGIAPAIRATSGAALAVLKDQQRGASGVRFGMLSGALTVAEVTIAVACLAAAGLAGRSLLDATGTKSRLAGQQGLVADLQLVDAFTARPDGRVVAAASAIPPDRWAAVTDQIRRDVAALPGVRAVALATRLPMQQHAGERIEIDGAAEGDLAAGGRVIGTEVTPELFDLFGARLLAGRLINVTDTPASEPVAVVNRALAVRFFGRDNPVGRRLRRVDAERPQPWVTIVGVVGELPMNPAGDEQPGYYRSFAQEPASAFSLAARVDASPTSLSVAVKRIARRADQRIESPGSRRTRRWPTECWCRTRC